MGYYTSFELSFSTGSKDEAKLALEEIRKLNVFGSPDANESESECSYTVNGTAKWYDWENDMRLLSSRVKGVLFTLFGDGEDSDDKWVAYFENGKFQYSPAKISYDEPDINLMCMDTKTVTTTRYSYERE